MKIGRLLHLLLCRIGLHVLWPAGNGGLYCRCCERLIRLERHSLPGGDVEPLGVEYWGWPLRCARGGEGEPTP